MLTFPPFPSLPFPSLPFPSVETGHLEAAGRIQVKEPDLRLMNNGQVKAIGNWNALIKQVACTGGGNFLIDSQPLVRQNVI
jgi:hypothetical protein